MLPTKGYFQDIECPYFNSLCGRPYCHFRHRKKPSEHVEELVESEKETDSVPTYKPTPKSQLADFHNSRSHIPISYVPDLAFRSSKNPRSTKFENPTYNPTPLSILSSANNKNQPLTEENKEHLKVIKEIKQNIASVEYDPTISLQTVDDLDVDLSNEFDLIDEILNADEKNLKEKSEENDIQEKVQSKSDETSIRSEKTKSNDKSEKSNSKQDESKKRESGGTKDNKEKYSSSKKDSSSHKNNYKKHRIKDKSRSPSQEVSKAEKKHKSRDKSRSPSRGTSRTDKKSVSKDKSNSPKSETKSDKKHNKSKDKSRSPSLETSKNDKKHKSKDKTRNSSQESQKDKEKHASKDKHRSKDELKKDKSVSKSKDSQKCKESTKSSKDKSESKTEKDSSKKSDRSHQRKNKEKEKSDSNSKSKNHKSSRKDVDKQHEKDKEGHRSKDRAKSKSEERKRTDSTNSEKMELNDNDYNFLNDADLADDSDVDINEDETLMECYRIFNEDPPKPPENHLADRTSEHMDTSSDMDPNANDHHGKKRVAHANTENSSTNFKYTYNKPKIVETPGQTLSNRYKIAKLAQANREQELLIKELQSQQQVAVKRPATTLLEAARERKRLRDMEQQSRSSNLIDDILGGSTKTPAQKMAPKKIAPAQNVLLMAKAKERIKQIKPVAVTKTIAHTQKGSRVAHVPDVSLSDIPDVLQADKSKLPVNVRTRFLTMIADECVKLYVSREEAYSRALKEEFACYEKCKVLTSYRNSAMLAVNRLRKEILERNKNGLGLITEDSGEISNMNSTAQFYNKVKHWVLTDEELDIHGYPKQSDEHGVAVIKNFKSQLPSNLDPNQRVCSRCHRFYHVDDDGWNLFDEECCYHSMKKRTIRGEQTYLCCKSNDEMGCATSDTHVFDGFTSPRLEGFQTTMEPDFEEDPRSTAVYALDCEMCYTTKGLELTRVTIVDIDCKTVYESFVKPLNPIIDYNTKFSGITKEQMDKTSTNILQVQANILHLCNSQTILVGHSLESDMKALKIVHGNVIDTSVLFPHKMGLPHKRALRALASELLRKIIQNDVSGHDSAEDAITCMELLKWKLKEESKRRPSK